MHSDHVFSCDYAVAYAKARLSLVVIARDFLAKIGECLDAYFGELWANPRFCRPPEEHLEIQNGPRRPPSPSTAVPE